jgi:gliding motility-associated-like protein
MKKNILLTFSFLIVSLYLKATTFVVINTNDSGAGSMRDAITNVNGAGAGTHTINATGVSGTILLVTTLPTIAADVIINGPSSGAPLNISGNSTISCVATSAGFTVTFNYINFIDGTSGANAGAIANDAVLNLNHCSFTNNRAPAGTGGCVFSNGNIHVSNCIFSNNSCDGYGGVFEFYGTFISVDSSSFTGNSSATGGGAAIDANGNGNALVRYSTFFNNTGQTDAVFWTDGTDTIIGCTFNNNNATQNIVSLTGANSLVINSTFSQNTSSGDCGGIFMGGSATSLVNCTIFGNTAQNGGGVIDNEGDSNISNCIIVGNTASASGSDYYSFSGFPLLSTNGHNILSDVTGVLFLGNTAGNVVAPAATVINVALANNGGKTFTHALPFCSPAINAGTATGAMATDQRGVARVGTVDIGAFEADAAHALPIVTLSALPATVSSGSSTVLTAGGGVSYVWNTGASGASNTITAFPVADSTFKVVATDINGCKDSATATVTVTPASACPMNIIASQTTICLGGSTVLTASAANTYLWNTLATSNSITVSPIADSTFKVIGTQIGGCTDSSTVTITVKPLPIVTLTALPATITLGASTVLTAGGGGTYVWNTLETTNSITASPIADSTFKVIVTGLNGCVDSASVTVTVTPASACPMSIIASQTTICLGGSTVLTASAANTYLWNTLATTNSITVSPIADSTFKVVGTQAGGCKDSATVTITVKPLPVITLSASPISISLGSSTVLTAGGGSTYVWNTGASGASNTITAFPVADSTFKVIGTGLNGCVDSASVTVTVTPASACPMSIIASQTTICLGGSTVLMASSANTYLWNTLATTNSITVSPVADSTFKVIGTQAGGCKDSTTVTITVKPLPVITLSASPISVSLGSSTVLTAGGGSTYEWNTGASGASNTITAFPVADSTFKVIGTDLNGCIDSATVIVVVTNPACPMSIIASQTTICLGGSTVLTAASANTYLWNTLATTNSITVSPIADSTFKVIGTQIGGCLNSATITITVNSFSGGITTNASPGSICLGSSSDLTATAPSAVSYTWNSVAAANPFTVTPVADSLFNVVAIDANGCRDSTTVTVNVFPTSPITITTSSASLCLGTSASLTATSLTPLSYIWNTLETTSTISVSPAIDSAFKVIGTDINGCVDSASVSLVVASCGSVLAAENNYVFTPNGDGVNDYFRIDNSKLQTLNCQIFNRWGILVAELKAPKDSWDGRTTSGIECVNGVYYYLLTAKGKDSKDYSEKGFVELIK